MALEKAACLKNDSRLRSMGRAVCAVPLRSDGRMATFVAKDASRGVHVALCQVCEGGGKKDGDWCLTCQGKMWIPVVPDPTTSHLLLERKLFFDRLPANGHQRVVPAIGGNRQDCATRFNIAFSRSLDLGAACVV